MLSGLPSFKLLASVTMPLPPGGAVGVPPAYDTRGKSISHSRVWYGAVVLPSAVLVARTTHTAEKKSMTSSCLRVWIRQRPLQNREGAALFSRRVMA